MIRLWPKTLKGRTTLLVAALILLSHVIGLGIYITYNASDLSSAREQHVADQLVTLTRLLERLPKERRAGMAQEISDYSLQLSIDERARVALTDSQDKDTHSLRYLLAFAIGSSLNENILADYREIAGDDLSLVPVGGMADRKIFAQRVASLFRFREDLLISIQVADDQWLNALVPGHPFIDFFDPGLLPSVILMAVVTLALITWAVSRPLSALWNFVHAAEALGVNAARADPLPEDGPQEIRRAARAFNHMQQRVQSLIEDRTRMVAAMSHDFRTPLTRMRLRAEYVENPEEREKMVRNIDEMEAMIDSTLKFVNQDLAGEQRFKVDFVSLLTDLTIELDIEPPVFELHGARELHYYCSPVAMRRAFTNLITNALTHGGSARITVNLLPDEILVYVEDDGPGIPSSERENVFLPFYRLDPSRGRNTGGSGLGLSIVRSIIRSHGGDLSLRDAAGGGLLVRVSLPLINLDQADSMDKKVSY